GPDSRKVSLLSLGSGGIETHGQQVEKPKHDVLLRVDRLHAIELDVELCLPEYAVPDQDRVLGYAIAKEPVAKKREDHSADHQRPDADDQLVLQVPLEGHQECRERRQRLYGIFGDRLPDLADVEDRGERRRASPAV